METPRSPWSVFCAPRSRGPRAWSTGTPWLGAWGPPVLAHVDVLRQNVALGILRERVDPPQPQTGFVTGNKAGMEAFWGSVNRCRAVAAHPLPAPDGVLSPLDLPGATLWEETAAGEAVPGTSGGSGRHGGAQRLPGDSGTCHPFLPTMSQGCLKCSGTQAGFPAVPGTGEG